MAQIIIPTPLRKFTQNEAKVNISGENIRSAIESLTAQYPEIRNNILDESGKLRQFVKVYVGDEDIRALQQEDTVIDSNSVISIIPAIAGGVN